MRVVGQNMKTMTEDRRPLPREAHNRGAAGSDHDITPGLGLRKPRDPGGTPAWRGVVREVRAYVSQKRPCGGAARAYVSPGLSPHGRGNVSHCARCCI